MVAQLAFFGALAVVWIFLGGDWGWAATAGGVVVFLMGAVLAGGGLVALRRHLSPYPEPRSDATLVVGGVYRYVRHPIYGGIVLGALGLSLVDGNLAGLGLGLVLTALFYGKTGFEEQKLIERFPQYAGYRERVRCRLLPGIC